MRSLVMAVNLFMTAISSALSQAFVSVSEDPLLVWNYAIVTILAFVFGFAFYLTHRGLDKEEDALNMVADTKYEGRKKKDESDA